MLEAWLERLGAGAWHYKARNLAGGSKLGWKGSELELGWKAGRLEGLEAWLGSSYSRVYKRSASSHYSHLAVIR